MTYYAPAYPVSDDYDGHVRRNSLEPGSDYATPYGTPLRAAGAGVVTEVDNSVRGAEGRRVTIALDDGRQVSYIHLSKIYVYEGQRVAAGEYFAESGASGNGNEWDYGPHVHISLWPRQGMAWRDTIDFEPFTVGKAITDKDDEMIVNITGQAGVIRGGSYYIAEGEGTFLGAAAPGAPTLTAAAGVALRTRVTGI